MTYGMTFAYNIIQAPERLSEMSILGQPPVSRFSAEYLSGKSDKKCSEKVYTLINSENQEVQNGRNNDDRLSQAL